MRLRSLKKEIDLRNKIIIVISFLLLIIAIVLKTTYAIYQREEEITFINAKVRFPNASEISYSNKNENITNVEQALSDLYERFDN